ncbi:MAG: pseudouridine synthase [Planctomycetota bacterium]
MTDRSKQPKTRSSKGEPDPRPLSDPERGVRIQRYLADAGIAARRQCERLVTEGRVEINGTSVIELPIFVDPDTDRVAVDGRPVAGPERHIYLMLNKPAKCLSTAADEPGSGRRTVLDLVKHPGRARLFPVGRLDYDTTGLILLTNDGDLANALTHPRYGVHKTYRVVVKGRLEDEDLSSIEQGIYLAERRDGRTVGATRTARVELAIMRRDRERTVLEMTLREGRNRQVRRMLAHVGRPVKKLERIAMGPVRLKGLARGEWRELDRSELKALRRAARLEGGTPTKSRGTRRRRGARSTKPA